MIFTTVLLNCLWVEGGLAPDIQNKTSPCVTKKEERRKTRWEDSILSSNHSKDSSWSENNLGHDEF